MSQPKPPPVPSVAFSEDRAASLPSGELWKGFITPKKEKEAHFFRRKGQSSSSQQPKFDTPPPSLGILIGSRESIEQWARESGSGSSCLWTEAEGFSQNAAGKVLSKEFQLVYRLHSEKRVSFLPVWKGTVVEISPRSAVSYSDEEGLRKAHSVKKGIVGEVRPSASVAYWEATQSQSSASFNPTGDMDISMGFVRTLYLAVPEKAYWRLVLMFSPGAIIREYQELLSRSIGNSNFLDMDFQLLDLQKWLKDHPFAAFLEGSDVLLVRRGLGPVGLQWVVLRFAFGEGLMKSAIGEDLDELEVVLGTQASWRRQTVISSGERSQRQNLGKINWRNWTMPVKNGDFSGGPLTRLLLNALAGEHGLSVADVNSIESLFGSPAQWHYHSPTEVKNIQTVLALGTSKGMSWKEQCALSHLRSSAIDLKERGFHMLLNLLLGQGSRSDTIGGGALGGHDTGLLEEGTRQPVMQVHDSDSKRGVERLQVMDWLKCGFLEVLLDKAVVEGDERKAEGMEKIGIVNVEVASEVSLRVLELVPNEGSYQLAKLLVGFAHETCKDFTKLNLNLKQIGNFTLNTQRSSHDTEMEGKTLSSAKHKSANLQSIFAKVLRFCRLLSLLTSQSPLVGGPFAELGGLDLILDLYFCLVKRFPMNLRFGVLSSASGVGNSLEESLPGETLKSQDTPLKVLPCILPHACIRRVTQACLMDHCMSPKTKMVDFAWPPSSDWKILCPFKNLMIDSRFTASDRSHHDVPLKKSLVRQKGLTSEVSKEAESNLPYQSTAPLFTPEANKGAGFSSVIASTVKNGLSSPRVMDDSGHPKPKQTRPIVPRLQLSTLKSSTSRRGSSMAEPSEVKALPTPTRQPSQVSSKTGASTSRFDILTAVIDLKLELLQTTNSLFSNCSRSLYNSRRKLLQKFQKEDEDHLALLFLPDIVSSFLSTVPEDICRKSKKMLFEVICSLDSGKILDSMQPTHSLAKDRNDEELAMSCNNGQGLPLSSPKRLVDSLLLDIGERLRTLVCHLENLPTTSKISKVEAASSSKQACATIGAMDNSSPLIENPTISSGHLLNLWADVGLLLRALVDFVLLWPGGGSVQCVLKLCGKDVECVLGLVAEYSSKRNWSFAQILTMEYLLKFLTACMRRSGLEKISESHVWNEVDTFIWQLLLVNDVHWNCVKNFTTWVVMKSCQGCFRKLFEGYQKVLWEPLEIYYSMLGEQVKYKSEAENLACSLHGVDMLRIIFSFLRVSILMMKKRLRCQSQINPSCPALFMERLPFLFDFLMNPIEGILMSVIRSPIPCLKVNNLQKEAEDNSANLLESSTESHVSSRLEYALSVNDLNLYANHGQDSCRKCPSTPCSASCAHNFSSYLKKESLEMLAEIYSVKVFGHHDELCSLCVYPRDQNPFLFRKYVKPFLEIIFFYFLKYYNDKIDHSEPSIASPLTQGVSGRSKVSIKSGQQVTDSTITTDRALCHDTGLNKNDKSSVRCSGCSQDDKFTSVTCVTYCEVLRALAQNQTDDVNQSFQQTKVMKFLVREIGLEYEISQVATPRDTAPCIGATESEPCLQKFQDSDCEGLDLVISKVGVLWSGGRPKGPFSPNKTAKIETLKAILGESGGQGKILEDELFGAAGSPTSARESILSTLLPPIRKKVLEPRTSLVTAGHHTHEPMKKSLPSIVFPIRRQNDIDLFKKYNFGAFDPQPLGPTANFQGLQQAQNSGKLEEISEGETSSSKYTGRFFDLNEEVERQLEEEELLNLLHGFLKVRGAAQSRHFDVLDNIQEEGEVQNFSSKLAAFDPKKFRRSSESELSVDLGPSSPSKQKRSHPAIPKLNLSKSVRKGGPAIETNPFTENEFVPSTSSTLDSKSRLNAVLELQRELQKDDISSGSGSSWDFGTSYETGCQQRRLYRHAGLHVLLLELFVSLMLTPQGTLETSYSDRYPMENRKLNAPFFLSFHLNHAGNVYLLPCLSKRMRDFKPAAFRILKLTWRALFNPTIYTNRVHIARGAASQVYTAKVRRNFSDLDGGKDKLVVLKVVDVPKGPYDPCKFFDVYSEVEILEKFLGEPAICQIVDYGVDTESFILVLKHYKCSLHTWRLGQRGNSGCDMFSPTEIQRVEATSKFVLEKLPFYLEVYSAILQAVKKLEIENVVHYDLKCDNVLLDPSDSTCMESEFWSPRWPPADQSKPLPFRICIADFGQSKASTHLGGECTVRNRGTEYVKSPEMLKLLSGQSQRDSDFNLRTTDEGVGKAVDVWSLGCLLYELLTGEYLFYDEDWLQFFMRVTLPSEELISKEKAAKLENYGPLVDLLKFILVRDPLQRPTLDEVTICVEQLQLKLESQPLHNTRNGDGVLEKLQTLSESGSYTEASEFSFETDNSSDKFEQKSHVTEPNLSEKWKPKTHGMQYNAPGRFKQKRNLRELICCCQCGEQE